MHTNNVYDGMNLYVTMEYHIQIYLTTGTHRMSSHNYVISHSTWLYICNMDYFSIKMSFCSAVWYHAVPQGSSIVQMTTGQLAWWRMKSLVLPSIVLRTTPTPRVPVTTNFGFSWVMKSEMACSGLTPTFSTRISTSIYRKKEPIPCHKISIE